MRCTWFALLSICSIISVADLTYIHTYRTGLLPFFAQNACRWRSLKNFCLPKPADNDDYDQTILVKALDQLKKRLKEFQDGNPKFSKEFYQAWTALDVLFSPEIFAPCLDSCENAPSSPSSIPGDIRRKMKDASKAGRYADKYISYITY